MEIKERIEAKQRSKEELLKEYQALHQRGQEVGKQLIEIEAEIKVLNEVLADTK